MPSITTRKLGYENAKLWRSSLYNSGNNDPVLYVFIGNHVPYANEASPDSIVDTISDEKSVWDNMYAAKRMTGNDVELVIPRIDWAANTNYRQYDDRIDYSTLLSANNTTGLEPMYIITSERNVYLCVSNNSSANSTVEPSGDYTTSNGNIATVDGYIWKYMYTLTAEERMRFLTPGYMPVKTLTLNDNSLQWNVQNDASPGAIHNIIVLNGGSNYTSNDISVIITGDGFEANAYAIRNVTTNSISSIVVDTKGTKYTYASVSVYANNESSDAVARAIIAPPGGHGSDPLTELGGSYLMLNPKFQGVEDGTLIAQNDYRQVAFIEDPYSYGTTSIIGNTIVSQTTNFTLNGTSAEYIEDEIVYQGDNLPNAIFTGIVAEWDSPNNVIKLTNVEGDPGNELLIGNTSGAGRFLSSVTNPDMEPYTGKLLYIDNISPIERAEDQTETFQIVLKF